MFCYVSSRLRPFLDHFKFGACFSLSLTLHSLENLVIACCFPDFSAHLSKFSQLKFRKSVQFANIAKILPRENFMLYGITKSRNCKMWEYFLKFNHVF